MQISKKEILFIYNSNDLQDRQALGYAKSLPNHKVKELDLQKDNFTETQVKQIADLLEVEPVSLMDRSSDTFKKSFANVDLSGSDALKAMASKPELIKTPIAVYNDQAVSIRSPFQLVKQDLDQLPSIQDYSAPSNGIEIVHDTGNHKFFANLGKEQMVLEYQPLSPGAIDFTSTYVPVDYRNQGLGTKLVSFALRYADVENLKVRASCPFVAEYLEDHPKYSHLLMK